MAPKPLTFRQRDVAAALKAALDAGVTPTRLEIDKSGKIVVEFGTAKPQTVADDGGWEASIRAAESREAAPRKMRPKV